MKLLVSKLFILAICLNTGYCGDVVVGFSPSNVRFGLGSSLHLSNLDDVLAASLGYTPHNFFWSGLTVTTPFSYPSAVVVLGIKDAGVAIKLEGTTYELNEDSSLKNAFSDLTSLIGNRAQRPVHFQQVEANDLVKETLSTLTLPSTKVLKSGKDDDFLKEMAVLPNLVDHIETSSSYSHGGQDVVFVNIDSFASLVKKYGVKSTQVEEATGIVRASIAQTISNLEKFYGNSVVVMTTLLSDTGKPHLRKRRATIGDDDPVKVDLNLASVYDEDYPVIFNIVLILAVILTVAILAISMSMAFMDPGRDSIIYRMTNPRMKKEQ